MAGGPVGAGETVMVGEAGPELVQFGASANVVPNSSLSNMTVDGSSLEAAAAKLERAATALASGGGAPTIVVVRDWAEAQATVPGLSRADPSFVYGRT
jgi:hypothetical protein